jgi:hypothetical protein
VPPAPEPLPLTDGSWQELWRHSQASRGKITAMGMARLWQTLEPGPPRPVAHAYAMAALAVPEENRAAEWEIDPAALPLQLSGDWRQRRFFRVQSQLGDDNARWRRGLAALGAPEQELRSPAAATAATAQGELFAFNRHEDLWHVNWRARLSLSKPFVPVPGVLQPFWVH